MAGRARVRVRGIHAQNQPSATALTGQRCAINLAGIAAEDIQRGQWLADERCFQPSRRIDVRMHMLGSSTTELQTWSPADRKSTRLNSSHVAISYAVFCLKKKTVNDIVTNVA